MRKVSRIALLIATLTFVLATGCYAMANNDTGYTWAEWRGERFLLPDNLCYDFGIDEQSMIMTDTYFMPEISMVLKVYDVDPKEAKTVDLEALNKTITSEFVQNPGAIEVLDIRNTKCYLSTSHYTTDENKAYLVKCADFISINKNEDQATVFALVLAYPADKDDSVYVSDFYKILTTEPDGFLYANYEFQDVDQVLKAYKENLEEDEKFFDEYLSKREKRNKATVDLLESMHNDDEEGTTDALYDYLISSLRDESNDETEQQERNTIGSYLGDKLSDTLKENATDENEEELIDAISNSAGDYLDAYLEGLMGSLGG